jgi:hypothetical protein
MVGMTGRFDTAARTFSGRIQGPGCATFSVKLDPAQALTTRAPDQVGGQPSAPGSSTAPPATAASQPATASKGTTQTASRSVPAQAQPATAQNASASPEKAHDPFAETKLNCESDEILRNFYDCECYTRRAVELLNKSGLVRPPEPIKDAFAAAALGKYSDAYGNARREAAKTTSCISTSGISRWVHEQVNSLTQSGLEGISRDCAAKAITEQYLKNPYPNYPYVTGVLREAAVACRR